MLTIEVHGDNVELDDEHKTLAVHGNVTVTAATDCPGMPTVSLAAEQVEGDLRTGKLVATEGVKLRSQQFALRGQRVDMDFREDNFTLAGGAMEVDIPSPQYVGKILRGFFFGDKVGRDGRVLYVIQGRITTCDRAQPHYTIGSNKVTFDTSTGRLDIYGGSVQLKMAKLRLPGHYHTLIDAPVGPDSMHLPLPGYSGFDGLYVNLMREFNSPEADWRLSGLLRVGTEFRFPAVLLAQHGHEDSLLTVAVTREEEVVWNLRDRSRLTRLPDLTYVHHLMSNSAGLPRLELTAYAGDISEHVEEDHVPLISHSRAGLALDYTPYPWQRRNRRGTWWAASGRDTFYDTGQNLSDLAVELGTGWQFADKFGASVSEIHHFTDGTSPFFYDKVWVQDELVGTLDTTFARNWRFQGLARWDLDRGSMRDYAVKLSRRMHCLTWSAGYSLGADLFSLGLDLNGLTGGTQPPVTAPLVAPGEVPPLPAPIPGEAAKASRFQVVP